MELLYNHLLERTRFSEAEFVARLAVPVLVYKPGRPAAASRIGTTTQNAGTPSVGWARLKGMLKEDAHAYRVQRLSLEGNSNERVLQLGRSQRSDVALFHPSVSKKHAKLHLRKDGIYLEDLGSKNGTRLGPHAMPAHKLERVLVPTLMLLGSVELNCLDAKSFHAFLGDLFVASAK